MIFFISGATNSMVYQNQVKSSKTAPTVAAATTDEDLLDISDTELIRASQVVESQLKFTNNVHHTTNNAMNIFSQFSQASSTNTQYHRDADFAMTYNQPAVSMQSHHNYQTGNRGGGGGAGGNNMGPPPPSNFPPSSYSAGAHISSTNPSYADFSDDEVRGEVMRLKNENMQKDGEVSEETRN